jgi:heme oxygenase (mycobilin-producing)
VLVVTRYTVPEPEAERFLGRAREALATLARRPGYRSGRIGRAAEEPTLWVLTTEWDNVGSYRRALGGFEVKMTAVPLLSLAHNEPSAFELLHAEEPGGPDPA